MALSRALYRCFSKVGGHRDTVDGPGKRANVVTANERLSHGFKSDALAGTNEED